MKFQVFSGYLKGAAMTLTAAAAMTALTACDDSFVYDDLDPCPHGVQLRFVYDYNMEFANAFPSQVDCLTVFFFNEDGKLVETRTNNTDDLKDEDWRMTVDLRPGEYTILAYGGMYCDSSSFHFVTDPKTTDLTKMEVELNKDCLTSPKGTNLHPLFYGKLDVEVEETDMNYRPYTVKMMKDTNNLRIILQQIDGDPLNEADFEFTITDNNTLFAWNNDLIPQPMITYYPWARGNQDVGVLPDGGNSTVCWAELSISRLVTGFSPTLVITRRSDGYRIINIPLNNYLLLLKSELFKTMEPQEYLDRESRWNMIFFLDRNHLWLKTQIVINDWVVRLNNADI